MRRPKCLIALVLLLRKTPRLHVVLSGSPAGQALNEYFNQRSLGILPRTRLWRGILILPRDHAECLRGRRRQAPGTNLRRAASAGIQCDVVADPWRAVHDLDLVLWRRGESGTPEAQSWLNEVHAAVARVEVTIAVARNEQGRPLGMAELIIDDTVCLIKHAMATTHDARWALHDFIVRTLIAQRVRCLMTDGGGLFGALRFTSNVRHFQHLLGYELRHVVPVDRG